MFPYTVYVLQYEPDDVLSGDAHTLVFARITSSTVISAISGAPGPFPVRNRYDLFSAALICHYSKKS